jgi:hypothetical protein
VAEPVLTAPKREPMPTTGLRGPMPPLQPIPTFRCASKPTMVKPALGADLKRLPRDKQGRAVLSEDVFPAIVAANDGGMSWPVIADTLGCAERNMRERVAKWKRRQTARGDAKEALQASVAERRQAGGPVPDGAPAGGTEGEERLLADPLPDAADGPSQVEELTELLAQVEGKVAAGMSLPSRLAEEPGPRSTAKALREQAQMEALAMKMWTKRESAPQAPQGVTMEELEQVLSCPPGSHGSSLIRANWLMSHPKIGPLLRGEHAPVRVVLSEEPPDPAYPPSFGVASYFIGYRAAWAKAFAEVKRQQSCSRKPSADQPTTPPVITPTKAGGFTVQITVNPVESSG